MLVKYALRESIIQTQSLISLLSLSYEMSLSLRLEIPAPTNTFNFPMDVVPLNPKRLLCECVFVIDMVDILQDYILVFDLYSEFYCT